MIHYGEEENEQGTNGFIEVVLCAMGSNKAKIKEKKEEKKKEKKNQFKPSFSLFGRK